MQNHYLFEATGMRLLILACVLYCIVPGYADDWKGQTVFPRQADVFLRDKGDVVGHFLYDGKVVRDLGETVEIVHSDPFGNRDRQGVVAKKDAILASEAVEYFTDLVAKQPRTVFPLVQRARAYELAGKHPQALVDLKSVVNLSSQANATHKAAIALHKEKKYPEAIAKYTEALKYDRSTALIYYNRSIVYKLLKQDDEGIADISEALWLQPKKDYYQERALRWKNLKKFDRAISDYTKCIELDRSKADAFFNRAMCHSEAGNTKAAINDYSSAIDRDSKDYFARYNRGLLYKKQGDLRNALTDFEQAEKLRPDDEKALTNLVRIHLQMDNHYKAKPIAEKLVQKYPKNAVNFVELAMCQRAIGNGSFSATLNKAIDIDPDNAHARHERGIWHLDHYRWQLALEDQNRAIAKDPRPDGYAARAWAYAGLKQWNEAMKDVDEAIKLNPKAIFPISVKAMLLANDDNPSKDVERAMDLVEKAFSLRAERDPDVQAARAAIHAVRGEWDKARQYGDNAYIGNTNKRFDRTYRYWARQYTQNQRAKYPEREMP